MIVHIKCVVFILLVAIFSAGCEGMPRSAAGSSNPDIAVESAPRFKKGQKVVKVLDPNSSGIVVSSSQDTVTIEFGKATQTLSTRDVRIAP